MVFGIHPDSVVRPDASLFFLHCWDIIKGDIYEAVLEFFNGIPLPRSFTTSTIVLIPKTEAPKSWNEYRPINLCNVINKIFSKLLNNRIAEILPEIISPFQSRFVKGRMISDNVLLAQDSGAHPPN